MCEDRIYGFTKYGNIYSILSLGIGENPAKFLIYETCDNSKTKCGILKLGSETNKTMMTSEISESQL